MSIPKKFFLLNIAFIATIKGAGDPSEKPLFIDTLADMINEDLSLPKLSSTGYKSTLSSASSVTATPTPTTILSPKFKLAAKFSPHFLPSTKEASSSKPTDFSISKKSLKRKLCTSPTPAASTLPALPSLIVNPDLPLITTPDLKSRTPIINRTAEDHLLEIAFEVLNNEIQTGKSNDFILEIGLKETLPSNLENPFGSPKSHLYGITKISTNLIDKIKTSPALNVLGAKKDELEELLLTLPSDSTK